MSHNSTEVYAVLGDVVRSRSYPDQQTLFETLRTELRWVSEQFTTAALLQPLTMTIGDEFQGVFVDLVSALRAILMAQLRLAGSVTLRFGVGHGSVETSPAVELPQGQSGTAWWAARNAIDSVKALEGDKDAYRSCAFQDAVPGSANAVEAFLVLRDRILHDMNEKDLAIALGLTMGRPQKEIARELGIDPAAVTRRKYTNRVDALLAAHDALSNA